MIALQTINIIRLISLFYIGAWFPEYFDIIHKQVWVIAINISIIIIFGSWLYYIITRPNTSNETA